MFFYVNDFVSAVDTCAKFWFLEIDENLRNSTRERVEKVNMLKTAVDKFFDERGKFLGLLKPCGTFH
jgi:hypothetical protein